MYLHKTPAMLKWLYPGLEWHGSREERTIYLTFDDGPVPEYTEFILGVLEKYQVRSTFFCVGDNVRKHPDIFQKVVSAGHSIGNHTMHHVKGWGMEPEDYMEDVAMCQAEMLSQGIDTNLFRPPYGRATRKQLSALGDYRVIMWDVLSGDFDQSLSPARCYQKTIKAVRNGSYIVFHDNDKARERLFFVLPKLIDELLEQQFLFKAL